MFEPPIERRLTRSECPSDARFNKVQMTELMWNRFVTPKGLFLSVGSVLLLLLALVPIWNAVTLLQDLNYTFWAGRSVPILIICTCVAIFVCYVATIGYLFYNIADSKYAEQTIVGVVQVTIMLFGLFLITASVPITHQVELTYSDLMFNCGSSESSQRLYEYSTVLHNIRATPECAKMHSVEDCKGYQEVAPYTTLLKGMESYFLCSGFCYSPPDFAVYHGTWSPVTGASAYDGAWSPVTGASVAAATGYSALAPGSAPAPEPASSPGSAPGSAPAPGPAPGSAPAAASLMGIKRNMRQNHRQNLLSKALRNDEEKKLPVQYTDHQFYITPAYPPTLFSDKNYQASCDGMAARDMKNFAGVIGQQTYIQGLYLIAIAVLTSFMRLLTICLPRDFSATVDAWKLSASDSLERL